MAPRLILLFCILAGGVRTLVAEPVPATGFKFVRSLGGIDEYRLESNGLQVLLKPDHSVPVVTLNVTYRVGSRNEVTGNTGATHLLEHLMFKGSEHFNDPAGTSVKQYLEKVGGVYNATTSVDRTNYYATIGKAHLAGYLAIEADRMRNLWLHPSDLTSEMTVVRNEYERGENGPTQAISKVVYATAFVAQPYHHFTIGWRSDIEKIRVEKLRAFYDTFYWPNNATLTIVGDFDPAEALNLVKQDYGAFPSSPQPIPEMTTEEPEQEGARRVILKRPGQLGLVEIAFKSVPAMHADFAALRVLGRIFASGKSGRLYRALVDKGLAADVGASPDMTRDPGLLSILAALTPGSTHAQVEQAILDVIADVKEKGVTADEISRSVRQQKVSTAFGRDGSMSIAIALNEWIAAGDWTLFVTHDDKIAQVTSDDVQRVANKYLDADHSTTAWFVPIVSAKK